MAAFRRLLLSVAAVGLFSAVANAQIFNNSALQCVANAGVPPIVRSEGLTELVGDVTLNCNGGIPTQLGAIVPGSNIQIFLNTNITSRLLASGGWSEALLMIDEPHSTTSPTTPLLVCGDANTNEVVNNPGVCTILGTGNGVGVYSGGAGRPNVFQGRQQGANSILFAGVPVDPPGTLYTRVIRITNVRANANQLGVSSTLVPTQITMFISITGATSVPINNPTQTVAFIREGLVGSVRSAGTYLQCIGQNSSLFSGSASNPSPNAINNGTDTGTFGTGGFQHVLRVEEGFASSFKVKNISFRLNSADAYPADLDQNVPGAIYNTETGFLNSTIDPSPNPPIQLVTTSGQVGATPNFPNVRGLPGAGVANHGTRIMFRFTGIPNGLGIWVPPVVNLINPLAASGAPATGFAVLTSTDAQGGGGFTGPGSTTNAQRVSIFNGEGQAVYEILGSDPFAIERMNVPLAVAYTANPGNNLPAPGVQAQVAISFAPLSNVGTASDTAPIPRFAPGAAPRNVFIVQKCNCNLLFPFVTNQLGYDTGVAISNTSLDTGTGFGTTPEQGTITINYYCGQPGCSSPAADTTNAAVPAGQQLTFTLSGGGGYGIDPTPGFQGYIIAQSQFRFCHGFAYISAQGALPTSNGASMGYVALVMDPGGLYRPLTIGESLGH